MPDSIAPVEVKRHLDHVIEKAVNTREAREEEREGGREKETHLPIGGAVLAVAVAGPGDGQTVEHVVRVEEVGFGDGRIALVDADAHA